MGGWVVGKPSVLLHTTDSGKSWERIPLSPKLPGEPSGVTALGGSKAEMTTSTGAIYTTTNAGRNWKAEVKESIDATLNRVSSSGVSGASYYSGSVGNIKRAADGSFICRVARQLLPDLEARGRLLAAPQPRDTAPHHGHGLRGQQRAERRLDDFERRPDGPCWSFCQYRCRPRILRCVHRQWRLRHPRLRL